MKSVLLRAILAWLLLGAVNAAMAFDADAARRPVDHFHQGLLEVMRAGESLDYNARRDRLSALLQQHMDIPFISDLLMGSARDTLSPGERDELGKVMLKYAVSALAGAFGSYGGQRFETGAVSQLESGRARVRGEFIKSDGGAVKLNYLVNPHADEWRIIDLWYDGVSGLKIYRAEFRSVLARQPVSALLAELRKRIAKLEADNL